MYKSLFSAQMACIHEHQICWILNITGLLHGVSGTSGGSEMCGPTLSVCTWHTACPEYTHGTGLERLALPMGRCCCPGIWKFPLSVWRFLFPLGHNFHIGKEDIAEERQGCNTHYSANQMNRCWNVGSLSSPRRIITANCVCVQQKKSKCATLEQNPNKPRWGN